ncbi:MAG: peptidoglycan DD-metalloendopeptidase family protein [Acidobacteriota bacterium]|nr:MAG: peptidoglycan DD-metalloendopeptidase family protein [Acidobacteriota bacterium]
MRRGGPVGERLARAVRRDGWPSRVSLGDFGLLALTALACWSLGCGPARYVSRESGPPPAPRATAEVYEEVPEQILEQAPRVAGIVHVVRRGETLWRISRAYGVALSTLVEANHLDDPNRIAVGQRLWIPGATREREMPRPAPGPDASPVDGQWVWPVEGPISSRFGAPRRHGPHTGIDILVPRGTAIRAARDGRVRFAGQRSGYGLLVVIDHDGDYSSWYGHGRKLLVRAGERVRKGDVIARSGATGNASAPHLHFELRRRGRPLDPVLFLPLS